MPIQTDSDLEEAVQEFQRLKDAAKDSPEAARRQELDAEIRAYYLQHTADLKKGKPYGS